MSTAKKKQQKNNCLIGQMREVIKTFGWQIGFTWALHYENMYIQIYRKKIT